MKLTVCQLPTNLSPDQPVWADFVQRIEHAQADLALLNEMPFGPWIASESTFDTDLAEAIVEAHESALPALRKLPTAVLSSRPIAGPSSGPAAGPNSAAGKLCNEAFLLADDVYTPVHHKHYFPQEDGFFEESWFAPALPGFDVVEFRGLRIGVLLCTELMFTEWARHYRRQGAHVIVVPRASGNCMRCWDAAARMAAIVSGCYVLSSNRASVGTRSRQQFGGYGFAYSPTGELLYMTSEATPIFSVNIDVARVTEAQRKYPCNVREA